MHHTHLIGRVAGVGVFAAAILLATTHANGESRSKGKDREEAVTCSSNYQSGLDREQSGHLIEASELFLACAKESCGSLLQECGSKHIQLTSEIPSVVPVVTDGRGHPAVEVEVKMDGEVLTSHLDGHALRVDPGAHEFAFSTANAGVFSTQKLMILQGQRNRQIAASLPSPKHERKGPIAASDPSAK
jgi:hypothetical protein